VHHVLDVMHCEKNLCKMLLKIIMEENDGANCREDMRSRGICKPLWLREVCNGDRYLIPNAPYVLINEKRQIFIATLKDLQTPTSYVGALYRRISDGIEIHDFHVLIQQVLPLYLRRIGNIKVVGVIMRVSRIFRKICSKDGDTILKVEMKEDVFKTLFTLEKKLLPPCFNVMLHLLVHLVQELFLCGPVHI
jgi:hypothetical protein